MFNENRTRTLGILGMLGDGRLARIALTLFPIGWAMLILGGIVTLINGSDENLFIPLGVLTILIFGLLTGIIVERGKKWQGWTRYALLLQALYFLLVMMILPPLLTGSNDPTLLTESLWMATWFFMGLALATQGETAVVVEAA